MITSLMHDPLFCITIGPLITSQTTYTLLHPIGQLYSFTMSSKLILTFPVIVDIPMNDCMNVSSISVIESLLYLIISLSIFPEILLLTQNQRIMNHSGEPCSFVSYLTVEFLDPHVSSHNYYFIFTELFCIR